jgi:hypothetical protein
VDEIRPGKKALSDEARRSTCAPPAPPPHPAPVASGPTRTPVVDPHRIAGLRVADASACRPSPTNTNAIAIVILAAADFIRQDQA